MTTALVSRTQERADIKKIRKPRFTKWTAVSIASIVSGIGLWWLASLSNQGTLPSPPEVVARYGDLLSGPKYLLIGDILASLRRVFIGFFIGAGLAIPLGFAMGWYRVVRAIVEPWTQFFRTIPPLALIPLAIVFLGIDEVPKVVVITLASFLVAIIATFQGVVNVDRTLINAGRVLGANDWTIFRRIAASPFPPRCPSSWWASVRGSAQLGRPSWRQNSSPPSRAWASECRTH